MTSALSIPNGPTDVTCEWLSSVLSAAGAPIEVRDVDVDPIGTGQTGATYRVAVTYAVDQPDSPTSYAIKLPSQDATVRERVALGYRSEHAFYTEVAHRVGVPVPHCYHCEITGDGTDFALLLADMAPAVQGDQIGGCSPEEARLAVEALAGLHGPTWCAPEWMELPGIAMPKPGDDAATKGLGEVAMMAADMTLEKLGDRVSGEDRETFTSAMALVTPWLAIPGPYALMHGDYRLDNMLFDPDRTRITVVDWQTLGVGLPARDLAYFTATSLLPEVRPAVEHELVRRYHEQLLGYGVTDYDFDSCWRDYRLGVLQAPLITALGFAFAASTDRGDDMVSTMLLRGCQAIRDLDSLTLLT